MTGKVDLECNNIKFYYCYTDWSENTAKGNNQDTTSPQNISC